jgi:hypothetical protein
MNNGNKITDYEIFCDELYQYWKKQNFEEDDVLVNLFQMEYSPEPYFVLKDGGNPLYVLLTNPGSGMYFQHISNHENVDFKKFQGILSTIYTSDSFRKGKGSAVAYRRLMKSIEFSNYLGYNGVVNIETLPFHSNTLSKSKALKAIKKSITLSKYQIALKSFLNDKPILIVSACNSKESVSNNTILKSEWLKYQCELASIQIENLKMKVLTTKNDKITSAIFSFRNKHIVLMMGSNNLPSIRS